MQCLAIALGYFRGERVMEWARQQIELANQRVQQGTSTNDEAIWNQFRRDFLHTWQDTSILEDAQIKLDELAMSKEIMLEDYIASFNACIAELQWAINHPGTVKAFKQGMSIWLLRKIYGQTPYPAENDLIAWQDVARREMSRALLIKQETGSSYNRGTVRENYMRQERPGKNQSNGRRKQERDPNAMDIDVAETNQAEARPETLGQITPEEKKCLLAEGQCFRCKRQGHLSRGCPDRSKRAIG